MTRLIFLLYGVASYLLFLGTYAYLAAFVGNLDFLISKSIDSPRQGALGTAVVVDLLLVALFAVQHSVMARPGFKRIWTRVIPSPIERSTYVVFSCLALILLMCAWCPIGIVVWDVQNPAGRWLLYGLFALGWLTVPAVSLMINHLDLFGVRHVWLHFQGREYTHLPFSARMMYRHIRHPLYVGWAIAFWATPAMTMAHLLFATTLTLYMLIAVLFEERDLAHFHGQVYEEYRRRVPMFVPRPGASVTSERELLPHPQTDAAS